MKQTKLVPISSIIIIEGTEARQQTDPERVAHFKDFYLQGDGPKIPPINANLVQTGELGKDIYALFEGIHRLTAQKELKRKMVEVEINTEFTITLHDIDSIEIKKHVLLQAAAANSQHGLPLRGDDRKQTVLKLAQYGTSRMEIIKTGLMSKTSVFRLLKEDVAADRERKETEREEVKSKIQSKLAEGLKPREISAQTGVSEKAVWRVKKNKETGGNGKSKGARSSNGTDDKITWRNASEPGARGVEPSANEGDCPVRTKNGTDKAQLTLLNKVYELLREIPSDQAVDAEIVVDILPLLSKKFPSVAKIVADGGYSVELDKARCELDAALAEAARLRNELIDKNGIIELQADELRKRREHCTYACTFTKERLKPEFEKQLSFLVSRFKDNINALPLEKTEDLKEISIKGLGNNSYRFVKEDGKVYSANTKGGKWVETKESWDVIVRQFALDFAFSILSAIEWAQDNAIANGKSKGIFEQFKKAYDLSGLDNKDVNKRIARAEDGF